jgi:hypothetical protein
MANKPKQLSILGETSVLYLKYGLGILSVVALIWFLLYAPTGITGPMFSRIACTCSDEVSRSEEFEMAETVFAGNVVREEPLTLGSRGSLLEFEVISAWKGVHEPRFTILDDSVCPPNPKVGELWLIHGYRSDDGAIRMKTCGGGSSYLEYAKPEHLDYLGNAEWGARRVPHVILQQESVSNEIFTYFMSLIPWHYWSWVTIMGTTTGLAIWGIRHG